LLNSCSAVCPRCYHWSALSPKQADLVSILNSLLLNIRGRVDDDSVCFIKFDGGAEFITESSL
jgi:hypothetical protein